MRVHLKRPHIVKDLMQDITERREEKRRRIKKTTELFDPHQDFFSLHSSKKVLFSLGVTVTTNNNESPQLMVFMYTG